MDDTQLYYFLAINRMSGVGSIKAKWLFDQPYELSDWFSWSREELLQRKCPKALIEGFMKIDQRGIESDFQWRNAQKGRYLLALKDLNYPWILQEISDPPVLLYAEGDISILNDPKIAIIGSRHPTRSGLENARQFSYDLAQHGQVIVSGLAKGIDAQAHRAALEVGGKTIAVMGTGMDNIYPREHTQLSEKIRTQGLLLTEFPLKTPPIARHFPQRNRIISGLSSSVLVVEAAMRSGSLVTARFALEQNREVMAIPGSIKNQQSAGCHYLLQQGARLVTCSEEILGEVTLTPKERRHVMEMNADEVQLLSCFDDGIMSVDTLHHKMGLGLSEVLTALIELELKGRVRSLPGGYVRSEL